MSRRRTTRRWDGELGASRSRSYVFAAVCVLAVAIFLYTNGLIRRLESQAATLSRSVAGLCASTTYAAGENEELRAVFSDLIQAIDFPIVLGEFMALTPYVGFRTEWWALGGFDFGMMDVDEYKRPTAALPDYLIWGPRVGLTVSL